MTTRQMAEALALAPSSAVNPAATGRQLGVLQLPLRDTSGAVAWRRIPHAQIAYGQGPTVAIIAHARADSLDASLIVAELMRELHAPAITGCVRLLSCFEQTHTPAAQHILQQAIVEQVVDGADLVIELGGDPLEWEWCGTAAIHTGSKPNAIDRIADDARIAFGAPMSLRLLRPPVPPQRPDICLDDEQSPAPLVHAPAGAGSLSDACHARGIAHMHVSTGGDQADYSRREMLRIGCRNALITSEVLDASLTLRASRLFQCSPMADSVTTPVGGALHMRAIPGRNIYRGDVLAHIVDSATPWDTPTPVHAPRNAVVMAARRGSMVAPGDAITLLADEIQG